MATRFSRRRLLGGALAVAAFGPLVAACAPAAPTATPVPAKPTEAPKPAAAAPTATPVPAKPTEAPKPAPAAPTPTPAPARPAEPPAAPKPTAARATLTVWSRYDFTKDIATNYNQGPGKQINAELTSTTIPNVEMVAKLAAAIAAKAAPDLTTLDLIQGPLFNSLGAFLDITQPFKALPYSKEIADFAGPMLKVGTYPPGGKIYQVPLYSANSGMMYNKKLFKEAGLDPEKPPVTWDDYASFAKAIAKPPDRYGTVFSGTNRGYYGYFLMPFVWSNGGEWFSDDGKKWLLNSPEAEEAIQVWVDMVHKHGVAPKESFNWKDDDVAGAVKAQRVGIWYDGAWDVAGLKKTAPELNFGSLLIPRPNKPGAKHASFTGGDNFGILAQTKSPDQAFNVVEYFLSEAVQVDFLARDGWTPVREVFFNNKYFNAEPRYKPFVEALRVGHVPWTTKYDRVYDPMLTHLQAALAGRKTVKQALLDLEAAMTKILAEP